jgi:hypothetical protein
MLLCDSTHKAEPITQQVTHYTDSEITRVSSNVNSIRSRECHHNYKQQYILGDSGASIRVKTSGIGDRVRLRNQGMIYA